MCVIEFVCDFQRVGFSPGTPVYPQIALTYY